MAALSLQQADEGFSFLFAKNSAEQNFAKNS